MKNNCTKYHNTFVFMKNNRIWFFFLSKSLDIGKCQYFIKVKKNPSTSSEIYVREYMSYY